MQRATKSVFAIAVLTLAVSGSIAGEHNAVRVRGTIERIDGQVFVVKARDGAEWRLTLMDNGILVALAKASLSDIKPGLFVGSTGLPQPDGSQKAIEVHIFPATMRGADGGHYAWNLEPNSTMTIGTVEESVAGVDGLTLTLKYKTGDKKVLVTLQTVIVTYNPGDMTDLKPGTKIFVATAKKQPDSTLQAARINYGTDGLTPPM